MDSPDLSFLGVELQGGEYTLDHGTAVIGAQVPTTFYNPQWRPGQATPTPPDLLGKRSSWILIKYDQEGNEIRKSVPLKIVGVLKESKGESDYSVYMPLDDVTTFNQWILGRRINRSRDGYQQLVVNVDNVDQVLDISDQITQLGYQAYTPQSYVQGINSFFLILQVIFGGVGAIALLVAAIGIANTMAMAILERTREIGLMKAIGATNRDVLTIFLGEAAGIGFLGGLGGVLLGWSAGQVINVLALSYLAGQSAQQGGPPPSTAVYHTLMASHLYLNFCNPDWIDIGSIPRTTGCYDGAGHRIKIRVNAAKNSAHRLWTHFFCSVEENNDPSLRGKPFAVGGRPDQRGVVASCSYAARMFGVHSAMPMAQAIRACPELIIVSGRHGDYGKISHQVMEYLDTLTPLG